MDDTPEDKHFAFLKEKLSADNRVRLYKRDRNSGNIGNVKNEVISLCRGKYILEMDHDDEILCDCLRDAHDIFQTDEQIGFVYGDTIHLYRDGTNFKYSDFICKGYGGYYMEKIKGNWVYVYNTPNINNITLSHLVCLPNHPRIWKRSVLMELESYSEFLPICDDYEILLRTCCSKYKVAKNNKAQYIQYMNDGGNNFSNIRNSEINRLGPQYISPMFYKKYEVHDKMKTLGAYEDESYIQNQSQIWKRGEKYQHKKMNCRVNLNYDNQYCIINDALDVPATMERVRELYKNGRNDFLVLSNKITNEELQAKLDSYGFERMKCYSYIDCKEEEQLVAYFKMMYKNDNCEYEVIQKVNNEERNTIKQRVFIIHNNRKGGVNKYVNDIMNVYNNEYIFIETKEMLYKQNYTEYDILFIQNLLYCDINIDDITNLYDKFHYKIIIAIHDFIWLTSDVYKHSDSLQSAYRSENINIHENVSKLFHNSYKIIANSQFTYDIYYKYFDTNNIIMCYPNDYKIQNGIKNVPKIYNSTINIGMFSYLDRYKGEKYVNYLRNNACTKNMNINFYIIGENIQPHKENEFYEYVRKYNINGFLMLNEWGETYGYLLTKIINSGLPLLYNNFGAVKERIDYTQEHYFKVYDKECVNDIDPDYNVLDSQFNKFVEYINTNHGTVEAMNEDFTIVTRSVYDELFLSTVNVYQNREIPKVIFQTSKDVLPPYVKQLINMYCPNWKYSHFTDKECIKFFIDNPLTDFPDIIQKFHSFTQGQHKADIFRYYYLYLRGGVFLDSDAMFETNIGNIIQEYDSVFAKSFMKNEHLFNGFIATYPRNEIIYDALKHAYNAENNTLQSNYHYLCEELLRIVLSEQKKLSSQNMIIYQEYSDTIDGKGVGRFKNSNEETVFIHYWQDREIPSNLLLQNDNKMVMIPIGTFCYVARILEKLNYRYTSLPFDYTRTNIPMVNDCINNNFVDFLNKDNYTNNNQGIIKYGKDIFLHHDMGDVNVYNSMKRKTNRFLNIFDKHDIHKIYIAFFQPIGSWVDDTTVHQDGTDIDKIVFDLKQLYKTIHNRTENFHVIGIINKPSGRQCNKIIFNEENLSIYELETVTSIDGPTFTMKSDEVYSIKILKQILTTINPNFEKTHVINYENEIDREIPSNLSTLVMAYNNNYMVDNYHCTKGIKFLTYPPDKCIISELISKNHVWEPHMHNIFEKYINKESIVLEGGCHIGTHTLKLGLLGKQVLSFEPMIKSNIILRENLKINNITNVTVYNEGLSNKTEVAYFEWIGHNNPGGSGLTNNPMGKPNYEKNIKTSNYPVNLITIDSLQLEKLDFIKLDVEGYEINVIEGALDTIKKCNPIITMEVWENFNGKYSLQHAKSTFKILLDNGYTIHHIRGPDFLFLPSSTSSDFHF
jgi:FkbM family methyltransferase